MRHNGKINSLDLEADVGNAENAVAAAREAVFHSATAANRWMESFFAKNLLRHSLTSSELMRTLYAKVYLKFERTTSCTQFSSKRISGYLAMVMAKIFEI
jgi:hypothetical protein